MPLVLKGIFVIETKLRPIVIFSNNTYAIEIDLLTKMKQYHFGRQLNQADIAKKLGISQQIYSLIECGTQKTKLDFLLLYKKSPE